MKKTKKAMLGLWKFSGNPVGDSIRKAAIQVQKLRDIFHPQ
jgi:hypothetical protein